MRILFLTHYFPPEGNAPAARTYEHCVRWSKAGHDVTVITCVPNVPTGVPYEGYLNRLRPQVEMLDGIRVIRVWTLLAANAGFVRRILNYLSYMLAAIVAACFVKRPHVIIATSPQFFCGWAGVWASRLRRVPFVLEIRDLWPESIEAVGAIRSRLLLRFLEFLERRLYRAASHIVTVGDGYRQRICAKMSDKGRVTVITNGADVERFRPVDDPRFRHTWNLEDKFVCSYVGTIGMAHGLDVVLKTASLLRDKGRRDIAFCLVGDGAARQHLEAACRQAGLEEYVTFTGRQPRDEVPYILSGSDVCLIHLKKCDLFGSVLPSKMFETMAMARPIIMGVVGEARDVVMHAEAGIAMDPDSPTSLLDAVERLADDPALTRQLGQSARAHVAKHYNRDRLAGEMLTLLLTLAGQPMQAAANAGRADASLVDSNSESAFIPKMTAER